MFSATFAGIAPASVPGFVVAQIIGGGLAVARDPASSLPDAADVTAAEAADVIVPQERQA